LREFHRSLAGIVAKYDGKAEKALKFWNRMSQIGRARVVELEKQRDSRIENIKKSKKVEDKDEAIKNAKSAFNRQIRAAKTDQIALSSLFSELADGKLLALAQMTRAKDRSVMVQADKQIDSWLDQADNPLFYHYQRANIPDSERTAIPGLENSTKKNVGDDPASFIARREQILGEEHQYLNLLQ